MKLGNRVIIRSAGQIEDEIKKLKEMGFLTCQISFASPELLIEQNAKIIKNMIKEYGVEISAFSCSMPGPHEWNFTYGPSTIGFVPAAYRSERASVIKRLSDFLKPIGATDILAHAGFIPGDPFHPDYVGLICVLKDVANYLKKNGQYLIFETGQEPPTTLLRTIEDLANDNLGVNYDPANLLMYGTGNPVDSVDVLGKYIRNVHGKDGKYPINGRQLGDEVPLGKGMVDYPAFVSKLKSIGYDRYITIEREITGEQQIEDVMIAKKILERLIGLEAGE